MKKLFLSKAVTLIEVLGTAALIATLAAISVISVKDSVSAGQRSSVQKELQGLNAALQNFKSAGGTINEGSSASAAVSTLMQGTDLMAGISYTPLASAPALETTIGGVPYALEYDTAEGFSYVPSGAVSGDVLIGAGAESGVGVGGEVYPFDITSPDSLSQALSDFRSMDPNDPAYASYLDAINSAYNIGNLPQDNLDEIDSSLTAAGLINANNQWQEPAFDWNDPDAVLAAQAAIASNRTTNSEEYNRLLETFNAAVAAGSLDPQIQSTLWTEFSDAIVRRRNLSSDWQSVNLNGKNLDYKTLVGTNVTGSQLNGASYWLTNLSGLNLTGINLAGKNITQMNLSGATGPLGAELTRAADISSSNLAGVNMTGFNADGKSLMRVDLSGTTGLDASQLNGATSLRETNLTGLNLTGMDAAGKSLYGANLAGTTGVTGAQINNATEVQRSNLSNIDLTGFDPAGRSLLGVNLAGATGLTGTQLNGATDVARANLSQRDLAGFNPTGRSFYMTDLSGSTGITGTQLNGVTDVMFAGLANMDLTGFNPAGRDLAGVNLANTTGITPELLATTKGLVGVNLSGTGITRAALEAALIAAGKNTSPAAWYYNLDRVTF